MYIPAGEYVCGPIELVSNLVLYIEAGATLRFPAERLPFTRGRHQGIEAITPVPLIGGHDLDNCPDAIVQNSRAFAGTGIFLSTAPGELKDIILEGNTLSAAREAKEEKAAEYWETAEPATEGE